MFRGDGQFKVPSFFWRHNFSIDFFNLPNFKFGYRKDGFWSVKIGERIVSRLISCKLICRFIENWAALSIRIHRFAMNSKFCFSEIRAPIFITFDSRSRIFHWETFSWSQIEQKSLRIMSVQISRICFPLSWRVSTNALTIISLKKGQSSLFTIASFMKSF